MGRREAGVFLTVAGFALLGLLALRRKRSA